MKQPIVLPHHHGDKTDKVLESRPNEEKFVDVSSTFSLMSDTTRLKILWLLCHCEECVINIAAAMEMSSPAISHHLRMLKQTGLITSRKEGKEVYYSLANTEKAIIVHTIIDAIMEGDTNEKIL